MTAVPRKKLSPTEYLAIERKAEFKSAFLHGEMFAMAGASPEHNTAKENFIGELYPTDVDGQLATWGPNFESALRRSIADQRSSVMLADFASPAQLESSDR